MVGVPCLAGPLTPSEELLKRVITSPPTIPAMTPEIAEAPDAKAIPRHKGMATKKTTKPEGTSVFQCFRSLIMFIFRCASERKNPIAQFNAPSQERADGLGDPRLCDF